ncbi:MAG: hypothetical protein IJ719_05700 [Clostridia bacterium]|nr:hypothetical protein [Clostridia bacterium]
MGYYSDPTANKAIGAVSREWNRMVKLAIRIRKNETRNPEWVDSKRELFTGIYRRLLSDPMDLLEEMSN